MEKLEETFARWRRITAWAEGKYPRWTEYEFEFFDFIITTANRVGAEKTPGQGTLVRVARLTDHLNKMVIKMITRETDKEFYRRVIRSWEGHKPTEDEIRLAFPGRVPRKEISEIRFKGFPVLMTISAMRDARALYRPPPFPSELPGVWVDGPLEEEDSEAA